MSDPKCPAIVSPITSEALYSIQCQLPDGHDDWHEAIWRGLKLEFLDDLTIEYPVDTS